MTVHPSVQRLSNKLALLPLVAAGAAAAAYLPSVCRCVFPGYSASLVSAAAGLTPPSRAAHPLFSWVARHVAEWEWLSLPLRLNLLAAACGVGCAMVFAFLVGQMVFFSACEDAGGAARAGEAEDEDGALGKSEALSPEVLSYNRLALRVAWVSGALAAVLFALSRPVWSAATRLDDGLFSLLLGLLALAVFPYRNAGLRDLRVSCAAFFLVLGVFESCVVLLVTPWLAVQFFRVLYLESSRRLAAWAGILIAGLLALGCSLVAYRLNVPEPDFGSAASLLVAFVRELWAHHVFEARALFPAQGWLLVLLQFGLPCLFLVFGTRMMVSDRRAASAVAMVLLPLAVLPFLLDLPVGVHRVLRAAGAAPVVAAAVMTAAVAVASAGCLLHRLQDVAAAGEPGDEAEAAALRSGNRLRRVCGLLLPGLAALCTASVGRSICAVDSRQGEFADRVAVALLEEMGGRTCLVTSGLLDSHLLVQSRLLQKPLTLIALRPQPAPQDSQALGRLIETSPLFEGLSRVRLQNALDLSPVRFVMEWFASDVRAGEKAMLFAPPEIWTACGYRAIPEGMAFGGQKKSEPVDGEPLALKNARFGARVSADLVDGRSEGTFTAGLKDALRMRLSYMNNELGVLLEEASAPAAAYDAYQRAVAADPQNLSAAINLYELVKSGRAHPEMEAPLYKRMRQAVEKARITSPEGVTWLLQNSGTIRQQAFYLLQRAEWASVGAREVAAEKAAKALSLSVKTGVASLVESAATYLQAGNTAQAEACFSAVLEKEATNRDALIGLCTLALSQGRTSEAETWHRRALDAGVEPLALRYQTIMLALAKKEPDRALKLLEAATREAPGDSRYWTLLADLLIQRGDYQRVERQLLPDMQRALKSPKHFLVQAVRGMTLRGKGPAFHKEARAALLGALAQNAAAGDLWTALLKLDLEIGNREFIESDARRLLGYDPEHAFANYLMGSLLLERGSLPQSADFLLRSVERKPTSLACNDLAENLRRQQKLPEAERYARKALDLQPDLAPALDTLSNVLFDGGRYQESAQCAAKAVRAQPDNSMYQLSLLRAQVRLGDRASATQLAQAMAEKGMPVPEALKTEIGALR